MGALVTGTAENITLIADYMLLGDTEKKRKYEKKKAESTKEVKLTPEQEKQIDELKNLHKQIQQEQFKIHQLEQELQERQEVTKTEKCGAFFQGIMADETITETETDAIENYRKINDIDDKTYEEAWSTLGYSLVDVEDFKKAKDDTGGKMCVVCKTNPKEWCIFPCMHVVLCENCAKELQASTGPGTECPACHGDIEDIQRVYVD